GDPDLVAEVARVAGARDVYGHARDRARRDAEVLQVREVRVGDAREQPPRGRSLERERGRLFGDVLDVDLHAERVLAEPPKVRVGRGPAVGVLLEPRHRAVVDDLAALVAPRRVDDLTDLDLSRVARDDAVDEARGVGP